MLLSPLISNRLPAFAGASLDRHNRDRAVPHHHGVDKTTAMPRASALLEQLLALPIVYEGTSEAVRPEAVKPETVKRLLKSAFLQAHQSMKIKRNRDVGGSWGASVWVHTGNSKNKHHQPKPHRILADTNIAFGPDNFICAERSTLKQVFKRWPSELKDKQPRVDAMAVVGFDFLNPKWMNASPCQVCLESFEAAYPVVHPDTQMIYLRRKAPGGRLEVVVKPMASVLPFFQDRAKQADHSTPDASRIDSSLRALPVAFSEQAKAVFNTRMATLKKDYPGYTPAKLTRDMLEEARKAWEEGNAFDRGVRAEIQTGASVLMMPAESKDKKENRPQEGHPYSVTRGASLYPKHSVYLSADMDAVSKALSPPQYQKLEEAFAQWQKTLHNSTIWQPLKRVLSHVLRLVFTVAYGLMGLSHPVAMEKNSEKKSDKKPAKDLAMVAYYSDTDHKLPRYESLTSLWKLSGRDDILIALIDKNTKDKKTNATPERGRIQARIEVRTLREFLPVQYTKTSDL
ncbi:MAG: hypothetical protein K2X01_07405 [Cyanobacteria bacterium]|nr:hypothetical protein [Cyanobacteriota bacterium]